MGKYRIVSQDKDNRGKIGQPDMKKIVLNFKDQYNDSLGTSPKIGGFEINGGTGLTKGAQEAYDKFESWCEEKGLDCIYNTSEELDIIRFNLSNRVHNVNYNNEG
ncbi:hypothetical protein [Enterocloster bolteae]|uniref:hypothetical protein n=1 Tax=Enterocloster bolteae TaxID=208479 RepID=UPI002A81D947|nr:hypothetical protein [Enterocloster bolteae]